MLCKLLITKEVAQQPGEFNFWKINQLFYVVLY